MSNVRGQKEPPTGGAGKDRDPYFRDGSYESLAAAIINQAITDYFMLVSGFWKPHGRLNKETLERFFFSEEYELLTNYDPETIINMVQREAAKMILTYTIQKVKGSKRYKVVSVKDGATMGEYKNKKDALHAAADLQGIDYRMYMRIRRRDGVHDEEI